MKLPKKIKIGPKTYAVVVSDVLKYNSFKATHNYDKSLIQVEENHPPGVDLVDSLWHEILHGLFDQYEIKTPEEEQFVSCLAHGITAIFVDNPKFIDFCRKEAKK